MPKKSINIVNVGTIIGNAWVRRINPEIPVFPPVFYLQIRYIYMYIKKKITYILIKKYTTLDILYK